jgi:hypothetical protein
LKECDLKVVLLIAQRMANRKAVAPNRVGLQSLHESTPPDNPTSK